MVRAAMVAVVVAMIATAVPARAAGPPPICSDPDVLDWVRQSLREREPYGAMQSRTVNEAPGSVGDVVRCSVCVQPFVYDPGRRQMVPVSRCEAHGFVVRTLPRGFLVLSVD